MKSKPRSVHLSKARQVLEDRSIPEPNSGCLLWVGGVLPNGYGYMNIGSKNMGAHRAAWIVAYGEIPFGYCVCHKCDVKCCVNTKHLFLGTQKDNVADRDRKGRGASGTRNPFAKLNPGKVRRIRILRSAGIPQRRLAAMFGVSRNCIRLVESRKKWKAVP